MNFRGIVKNNPTNTTNPYVELLNGSYITANENDMVVWEKKEFLYRKDNGGNLGWFEIGDEAAPAWED